MKNRKVVLLLVFLLSVTLLTGCNKGEDKDGEVVENLEENNNALVESEIEKAEIIEADEYGITSEDEYVHFLDGRGEETKISKKPEKVVILFASFLDMWLANGGEIAGMVEPSEEYLLPELENVRTVGKRGSISLEEVMVLDPDLVILSSNTSAHTEMIAPLESAGVEVMALDYSFKDDYFKLSKLFALINDELDLYKAQAEKIKDEIQETIDKIPEEDNPSAIIIMSTKSNISVRTSNTTIGDRKSVV